MQYYVKPLVLLAGLGFVYLDNGRWLPSSLGVSSSFKGNPSLDDFRLCRIRPQPTVGEPWVQESSGVPVDYQCDGKPYHHFATLLEELILKESNVKLDWGKRPTITPHNNTSILIMGNSHTRQLFQALLCQYQDQVIDFSPLNEPGAFRARLIGNITIFGVCNSPVITTQSWQRILEHNILHQSLVSMDAIVLGHFNTAEESINTSYLITMLDYHKLFPQAPKVDDIAQLYSGPLIWTGMFAHRNIGAHQEAMKMVQHTNRSNVHAINARQYINQLPAPYDECSTDSHDVGTCVVDVADNRYREGHRCMGARGGHPDLIAWDVIELLYKELV